MHIEQARENSEKDFRPLEPRSTAENVKLHLEKILASHRFVSSPRCQLMLRYLVEKSLDGSIDTLKERTIGVEILKRDPDYDTNTDPAVRMTASEIRKKLAQYYYEQGNQDEVRIELPTGSYAPVFSLPEHTSGNAAASSPGEVVLPSAHVLTLESAPPVVLTQPAHPRRTIVAITALAAVGLVVGGGFLAWRAATAPTAIQEFWAPVLNSPDPLLIYPDQLRATSVKIDPISSRNPSGWVQQPPPTSIVPEGINVMVLGDALTMANVEGTLRGEKKRFSTRGVVATNYADLQKGADVLFGGFNNEWTIYLTRSMRYHLMNDAEGYDWIEDQKNPAMKIGLEKLDNDILASPQYGLVARVFVGETNQPAIIMAGVGPAGTVAAGDFATNSQYLSDFLKSAPKNWQKENMEIVISANVIDNQPGPPRVVASVFW